MGAEVFQGTHGSFSLGSVDLSPSPLADYAPTDYGRLADSSSILIGKTHIGRLHGRSFGIRGQIVLCSMPSRSSGHHSGGFEDTS
jgi:hypothetical protein